MTQCECVKRNGLQLDCPKKECRGQPCCSTKPYPLCCPSKYHWKLANKTMGKKSESVNGKWKVKNEKESVKGKVGGLECKPCFIQCYKC